MKRISFLLFLSYLLPFMICAQNPYHNLEKYWYYRQRLKDKFMVVSPGNERGTNIPALRRVPFSSTELGTEFSNSLNWGDASAELGKYILLLSTELKLLIEYGESYTETLNELSYALKALERLDQCAESYFRYELNKPLACMEYGNCYYYSNDDINGFFIRDDVTPYFTQDWVSSHPDFSSTLKVSSSLSDSYIKQGNEYIVNPDINKLYTKEMSQDQVWNIMPALAYIYKNIDISNLFTDVTGESVTMKQWAKKIALRIIHGNIHYSHGSLGTGYFAYSIVNPITRELVHSVESIYEFSVSGHFWTMIATGLYGEELQYGVNDAAYGKYMVYPMPNPLAEWYVDHGYLLLKSVANYLNEGEPNNDALYEALKINIEQCSNYSLDNLQFGFEHTALIYQLLYPTDPEKYSNINNLYSYIEGLLNVAPDQGPFEYGDENYPGYSKIWSRESHYSKPGSPWTDSYNEYMYKGEFNGIDYMVLHNLFWLAFIHKAPLVVYPSSNFNVLALPNSSDIGSTAIPGRIFFKGDGNLNKKINSSGGYIFNAKSFTFNPEFEIEAGASLYVTTTQAYANSQYPRYKKTTWHP